MNKQTKRFIMRWIVGPLIFKIFELTGEKGERVGYAAYADNTLEKPVASHEKLGALQNKLTEEQS